MYPLFLKIKIKSLAEEARIIRTEERKVPSKRQRKLLRAVAEGKISQAALYSDTLSGLPSRILIIPKKTYEANERRDSSVWQQLHNHRTINVRNAARHALLAYAFLRHRPYKTVERTTKAEPDWAEVAANVKRFRFGTTFTNMYDYKDILAAVLEWAGANGSSNQSN